MPELPEAEALREFLDTHLVGKEIARVLPVAISVLKTYDPPPGAVEGAEVTAVARHGKFLDLTTTGPAGELHLLIHLARAGRLRRQDPLPSGPPRPGKGPPALRTALTGGDGFDPTEAGTTKRLTVHLVRDPQDVPGVARLGPDPFADDFGPDPLADDFGPDAFAALLAGERRRTKGALRDQNLIAAGRLKAEKKSGLRVHGRTGEPCPVCGDTIREVSFSDSSLQYCPTCRTGGRPLADRRLSKLLE
ncbi:DNA-formamidopyrimidine glycosylase family protein [Streptomyces wedmorensis]|uniref:DNA-formamidopyrimidine glycosylase n=1 Tax=Streptomyces wedmorensis TaxID=43759 RepID=A0ABW6IQQ9_STRWE